MNAYQWTSRQKETVGSVYSIPPTLERVLRRGHTVFFITSPLMFVGGTNQLTMKGGSWSTLNPLSFLSFHPFFLDYPGSLVGIKHYFRIPTTRVREFVLALFGIFKKAVQGVFVVYDWIPLRYEIELNVRGQGKGGA